MSQGYLFDSNVFIYQLNGVLGVHGQGLLRDGLQVGGAYSMISRIEVLGYPQTDAERAIAERLFAGFKQKPLDEAVVERAIALRQARKIKIPDAIIAATALCHGLSLVTHNVRDFQWIDGLLLIDPLAESAASGGLGQC